MPSADPLKDLLELVRSAARDGVVEALQTQPSAAPKTLTPPPLLDKRALAHALGVSTATVDRLCRCGRLPYVVVGDVRRFDLEAVRSSLRVESPGPVKAHAANRAAEDMPIPGVRLLSRQGGSR